MVVHLLNRDTNVYLTDHVLQSWSNIITSESVLRDPCAPTNRTAWPSGLRRWLQAPVRKGVGSNPTAVIRSMHGICHGFEDERFFLLWNKFTVACVDTPTSAGFEPARAEPNGFLVHRLNHSATMSCKTMCQLRFCGNFGVWSFSMLMGTYNEVTASIPEPVVAPFCRAGQ